jgi:DNA polymerase I-like protein with 3'-5' exonuclease and polymerase domains
MMEEAVSHQAVYEELRALNGGQHFNPANLGDLRRVIYDKLGAPVTQRTVLGDPSVRSDVLRVLAVEDTQYGRFSRKLLAWREARKGQRTA